VFSLITFTHFDLNGSVALNHKSLNTGWIDDIKDKINQVKNSISQDLKDKLNDIKNSINYNYNTLMSEPKKILNNVKDIVIDSAICWKNEFSEFYSEIKNNKFKKDCDFGKNPLMLDIKLGLSNLPLFDDLSPYICGMVDNLNELLFTCQPGAILLDLFKRFLDAIKFDSIIDKIFDLLNKLNFGKFFILITSIFKKTMNNKFRFQDYNYSSNNYGNYDVLKYGFESCMSLTVSQLNQAEYNLQFIKTLYSEILIIYVGVSKFIKSLYKEVKEIASLKYMTLADDNNLFIMDTEIEIIKKVNKRAIGLWWLFKALGYAQSLILPYSDLVMVNLQGCVLSKQNDIFRDLCLYLNKSYCLQF